MSINLICEFSQTSFGLTKRTCHKCSQPLTTYKVRVNFPDKLLGHKSIHITQRYSHLFPGALKDAAEVMTKVLNI